MCLITNQKEPLIATEDITCYKTGVIKREIEIEGEVVYSSFHWFKYKFNKKYYTKLDYMFRPLDKCMFYSHVDSDFYNKKYKSIGILTEVSRGFHTCDTVDRLYIGEDNDIIECIIPKGSKYFKDETGCIVSNQIILKNKVTKK